MNALKPEHRQVLLDSIDEALAYYVNYYEENTIGEYNTAIDAAGLEKVTFNPEQTAELNKRAESIREQWVAEHSDDFDAKTLYDFTEQLFLQ